MDRIHGQDTWIGSKGYKDREQQILHTCRSGSNNIIARVACLRARLLGRLPAPVRDEVGRTKREGRMKSGNERGDVSTISPLHRMQGPVNEHGDDRDMHRSPLMQRDINSSSRLDVELPFPMGSWLCEGFMAMRCGMSNHHDDIMMEDDILMQDLWS